MRFIHGQILAVAAQVLYRHAEAVSGAYRLRAVHQGVDTDDPRYERLSDEAVVTTESPRDKPYRMYEGGILFRPLSDDEKLADTMATMQRQIRRLTELCEVLAEGGE